MDEVREAARHSADKLGRADAHGLIARTPRAKGSIGTGHTDHTTTQSARTDCDSGASPCSRPARIGKVEVLSSRILLRPTDLDRSRRFYRDVLGLAVYREFGPSDDPAVVFFLGQGLLEVSGHAPGPPGASLMIWLQVRDVRAEHDRLAAAGVRIVRKPVREPWGLVEMWIEDPDGVRVVLVEVPPDHPLRRDPR
jgi:catechol 2,3-dioxygenase-like lactoylglutathione lyase family enzyme